MNISWSLPIVDPVPPVQDGGPESWFDEWCDLEIQMSRVDGRDTWDRSIPHPGFEYPSDRELASDVFWHWRDVAYTPANWANALVEGWQMMADTTWASEPF